MSSVSFASVLRFGAFSADGLPEPLLELSTDATPVVVDLLRLRRRRAERLVPLPVPAVVVTAPLLPGPASSVLPVLPVLPASFRLRPALPDEDRWPP
jgi:hypothetical protein